MKYRTETDINILRWTVVNQTAVAVLVAKVPITASSRRTRRLMEEDSITLSFTLAEPVELRVGDYIIDELFGKFRIREKVMPQYQKSTGGYDYTVRFDSFYWQWEKYIFMLTALPKNQSESARYRKETSWMLTAALDQHALEVVRNVNMLTAELSLVSSTIKACVRIHGTAKKAKEVRFLAYDGVRICSALTQMANEYECEWWVTVERPDTSTDIKPEGDWADRDRDRDYIIIHFGKCEGTDEPLPLRLGYNVEEMNINRNSSEYADRLYVMGGTKNMPESYRKRALLNVTWKNLPNTQPILLQDDNRIIQPTMLGRGTEGTAGVTLQKVSTATETYKITVVYEGTFSGGKKVNWSPVSAQIGIERPEGFGTFAYTVDAELELIQSDGEGETKTTLASHTYSDQYTEGAGASGRTFYPGNTLAQGTKDDINLGTYTLRLTQTLTYTLFITPTVLDTYTHASGTFEVTKAGQSRTLSIAIYNIDKGEWNEYAATYNPTFADASLPESHYFQIDELRPPGENTDDVLNAFAQALFSGGGGSAECELRGVNPINIPFSWYVTEDQDPSCVTSIGERRLMLPEETGGYIPEDSEVRGRLAAYAGDRTEMVVINEEIYPRCYLKVTSVQTKEREYKEELSDGSYNVWTQTVYVIKAENINGNPFPFDRSYVRSGDKLQAVFISEIDEEKAYEEQELPWTIHDGYLLAGMTFDVSWEGGSLQTYTLISNEDYGAKLPNDILHPTVGDTFVLTGWDVKAMESLGLIEAAESQLLAFGTEYLQAMEEDQFTFECTMMSDWAWMLFGGDGTGLKALLADEEVDKALLSSDGKTLFGRDRKAYGSLPMYESGNAPLHEVNGKQIYCVNDTYFHLPEPGARVAVYHDALKGTKETRIIGYEYKLDIPYDTPHITVGETEAYSRLKQLEKKITKK